MPTILFLNKTHPCRFSGAEKVVWEVGTELADHGWDVHYLSPDSDEEPTHRNVTFHHVETPDSFFAEKAAFFLKGIPVYRQVVRRIDPDLVYDNVSPFPFLYAYLADYERLVTKVMAVHGWSAFTTKHHPVTKLGTFAGEQLYRLLDGERLLALSSSTKQRLAERVRTNPDSISVASFGINVESFTYEFSPDGPILSLCELTPRKGIDTLIEAWQWIERTNRHQERSLLIAGDGPARDKLESKAASLGLERVEFKGFVDEAEKLRLLQEAYCYVLPTRMEGLGISNLEAMASGCVVVSTDTYGVKDYIHHGENGVLVLPDNPRELSAALDRTMSAGAQYKRMAQEGRQTVEAEYRLDERVAAERELLEAKIQ